MKSFSYCGSFGTPTRNFRSYGSTQGTQDPYPAWTPNSSSPKQEQQPLMSDQQPLQPQQQQPNAPPPGPVDPRPKNFPSCRPIIHHDGEIPPHHTRFVRQAFVGWYFHSFGLLFNLACLLGALVEGLGLAGFFYALIAFVLGIPISFWVYWLLYSAVRKVSGFYFCVWFVFFALQIAAEIFFAIGIVGYGAAGLMMAIDAFDSKQTTLGIVMIVSLVLWVCITIYNIFVFNKARIAWNDLGGAEAAKKDFAKQAGQVAYDNRETIKQVAVENKDAIVQFAKDNKETIAQVAYDNRSVIDPKTSHV